MEVLKMKTLILKRNGFIIKGTASVTSWGGGEGSISMTPFHVKRLKEIKNKWNDGGFGVEKINGAICEIYDNFGQCENYRRQIVVGDVKDFCFDNHYAEF
jgi:hypothetical protein